MSPCPAYPSRTETRALSSYHSHHTQQSPVVVSAARSHDVVLAQFVVDARKNVESIVAAAGFLAAGIVIGGRLGVVGVVTVAVRRVGGLFVRGRVFLLLML